MSTIFASVFQYQFMTNAFLAAVLLSIAVGVIGSYIVARRLVFLSGGITHSSFGGIGMAYYFGLNPILGAAVFAILSAFGVEALSQRMDVREDSAIGILWSVGMAVGIVFVYLTPGYSPNLMSFLFGSILTVNQQDIFLLLLLNVLMLGFFLLFYRAILYLAFDESFARTQGIPVRTFSYILKGFIALTIIFSIRMVGIILLISMLTIPPTLANIFTKQFHRILLVSILVSFVGTVAGLAMSFGLNVPSGATIVIALSAMFAIAKLTNYIFVAVKRKLST